MIAKARELGYVVVAMDGNSEAPGFKEADHAEVGDICDTSAVLRTAETHEVGAIFPAGLPPAPDTGE